MYRFMKFDNVKKIAKVTKLSKRNIRFADGFNFDVGYRGHDLAVAINSDDITRPHVDIRRTTSGYGVFHFGGDEAPTKWFYTQDMAVLSALMWLVKQQRS